MLAALLAVAVAAVQTPIAVSVEAEGLGKGAAGTVVGVVLRVAPEDRGALGERVEVSLSFIVGGAVVDRGTAVVRLEHDGTALLYREWPAGTGEVKLVVSGLDGQRQGAWVGPFTVPVMDEPFEAPSDATADAIALAATPPDPTGIAFLPPPRAGGIGAIQLELKAPATTARVDFLQDEQALVQKQRPPWTVSISLGEAPRRTVVRAVAWAADGSFLGEDAIVLNGPAAQLPVEILLAPEVPGEEVRTVTVTTSAAARVEEVVLKLDDAPVARWLQCPCVVRLPVASLRAGRVLIAEAKADGGRQGDAVRVLGGDGFVEEVRIDQVELTVVVTDAAGRLVTDLPRDAFTVREDGAEIPIEGFGTTAELPLSLGILVDTSGSMAKTFEDVRRAISVFARDLVRPGDSYFLTSFAFDTTVEVPWTQEAQRLPKLLDTIVPEGGTALNDSVVRSLEQFRARRGRTALVLLSDGDDTSSRTSWDVTLRFCRTVRTPVFPIGLRISVLDFQSRSRLKEMAESTGGEAFFVGKAEELPEAYARIGAQLRAQYLLSYRSPSKKGKDEFRTVSVAVAKEGTTARTIAGYYPGW
jgi:VWFA-related protein